MESDRIWVGIDIGKRAHHAVAVDATGNEMWSVRVINDQGSIEELLSRAGCGPDVRWAVDLTSQRLRCSSPSLLNADNGLFMCRGGSSIA